MTAAHNFPQERVFILPSLHTSYIPYLKGVLYCRWISFFASLNIKRNIQNMHTHTKNVPIYFKNNLSNQRLEASASVDRIAFVDLCGIRSCQVIIKGNIQECSVLHMVYVLLRLIIYFNLNNFTNWNLHFQYFVLIL